MTLWILLAVAVASVLLAAALARKRAGREAPAEEYTALLRAVADLVFLADSEGTCLEWHSPATNNFGVAAQSILGRNLRDVFPADVEPLLRAGIREALQTPRTVVQEYTLGTRGGMRWYEARMARCAADRVVCVVRDRTGYGVDGETPRQRPPSEPPTETAVISIWDHDLETGALRVDPVVEQWLGTGKPAPSTFQPWLEQVHPADRERFLALHSGRLAGPRLPESGGGVTVLPDIEYRLVHADGSVRRVRHRGQRITGAEGFATRIVGTVTDITAWSQPRAATNEVRVLLQRVVNAHEEERRRIARELHDDLNQRVAALHMRSTILQTHLEETWPKLQDDVAELFRTTMDLADAVRSIARTLHPVMLDEAGLVPALRALADQIRPEGVEVRVNAPADRVEASAAAALCLYRIAQEALRNVVRHAGCPDAEVSLREMEAVLELRVKDAGVGFDPSRATSSGGLGLTVMRERVAALGGTFELRSLPGRGAEVVARVPRGSADRAGALPRGAKREWDGAAPDGRETSV